MASSAAADFARASRSYAPRTARWRGRSVSREWPPRPHPEPAILLPTSIPDPQPRTPALNPTTQPASLALYLQSPNPTLYPTPNPHLHPPAPNSNPQAYPPTCITSPNLHLQPSTSTLYPTPKPQLGPHSPDPQLYPHALPPTPNTTLNPNLYYYRLRKLYKRPTSSAITKYRNEAKSSKKQYGRDTCFIMCSSNNISLHLDFKRH